jgi:hypothetical protein
MRETFDHDHGVVFGKRRSFMGCDESIELGAGRPRRNNLGKLLPG